MSVQINYRRLIVSGFFIVGAFLALTHLQPTSAMAAAVSLSATPTTRTINSGQSTTYTILISRDNFNGKVTLSAANLPTGATATFNPNGTTGNSSVLTVVTKPTTPAGSFRVRVNGSASGVTIAPIYVTLNVKKPVKLSALPNSLSIIAGQSISAQINIARTNYSGPVILAASNLPAGVSVAFDNNPVYGEQTTMRIYSPGMLHEWAEYTIVLTATLYGQSVATDFVAVSLLVNCGVAWATQYGSDQVDARQDQDQSGDPIIDGRNGDVATDANGNIYVASSTFGTVDSQNPNQGERDVFVAKFNNSGQLLWINQFGSTVEDRPTEIVVDNAGRVFVGGFTLGTLPGNTPQGNVDYWIAMYDNNGVRQFLKQDGTQGQDGRFGFVIVPDNNGGGKFVTFENERSRIVTYTFNSAGARTFQSGVSPPYDTPYDIALGPNDSIYVVGTFTNINLTEYIVKIDSQGNEVWANTYGADARRRATRIIVDSAGNAYVSGRHAAPNAIENPRAFIAKYDANDGSDIWFHYEPSPIFNIWHDVINALGFDSNGDIITAGMTQGVIGERNGDGGPPGHDDAWVSRRKSSDGEMVWVKQFPVQGLDAFDAIAFDGNNGIILSGHTVNFKNNIGDSDALLMRYVDSIPPIQVSLVPFITGFNPPSGTGFQVITIEGRNFFGITGVRFNGLAATYTVMSSSRIEAQVSPGATTGVVTLSTGCRNFKSALDFIVVP